MTISFPHFGSTAVDILVLGGWNSPVICQNVGVAGKGIQTSAFFPLVTQASAFQHEGQPGNASHRLVQQFPAMVRCKERQDRWGIVLKNICVQKSTYAWTLILSLKSRHPYNRKYSTNTTFLCDREYWMVYRWPGFSPLYKLAPALQFFTLKV